MEINVTATSVFNYKTYSMTRKVEYDVVENQELRKIMELSNVLDMDSINLVNHVCDNNISAVDLDTKFMSIENRQKYLKQLMTKEVIDNFPELSQEVRVLFKSIMQNIDYIKSIEEG